VAVHCLSDSVVEGATEVSKHSGGAAIVFIIIAFLLGSFLGFNGGAGYVCQKRGYDRWSFAGGVCVRDTIVIEPYATK